MFYEERKTLDQNPIMKSKKPFVGPNKRRIIISFVVFKGELFCGLKGKKHLWVLRYFLVLQGDGGSLCKGANCDNF